MNNDWEHFGEEIKQTIQDAIDTKDYSRLNRKQIRCRKPGVSSESRIEDVGNEKL